MAIYSLDVEVQSILQYGFDYIRANLDILDDIFANFKEPHLMNKFGDKEIGRIRTWIQDNDTPIVLAWSLNPQRIPCISVHIAQSTEDVGNAFMADHGGIITEPKDPRIIIPTFVPSGYDVAGGTVEVPSNISLELVRPGHVIKDGKDELYQIDEINGTELVFNTEGTPIDASKITIVSFIRTDIFKSGQSYLREEVDIGIHGHGDQNTVLWMYYIIIWVLLRFKPEIEKRCMDISTFSASDFRRESQYLADNVFTRWIRFSARTRVTWKEGPLNQIDTIVATVKTDADDE